MRMRPSRRSSTRPASRRTLRCCETAGREISKDSASFIILSSPSERRSSNSRRVGSAMARKTALVAAGRATSPIIIKVLIKCQEGHRGDCSEYEAVVAFAARDVFAVEVFEERDRVLAGDAGPVFEGG